MNIIELILQFISKVISSVKGIPTPQTTYIAPTPISTTIPQVSAPAIISVAQANLPIVTPGALYKGIDISVVQGNNINFQAVAESGVSFCVVRCSVGNDGRDQNYTKNIAEAKAAGILTMAYHFIYPLPDVPGKIGRDPVSQATAHFNAANGELAAIDCEWPAPQDFSTWGCSPAQINAWILQYLKTYTALSGGRKPLIYTYPFWEKAIGFPLELVQYPLWVASYESTPAAISPWGTNWTMWQTTGGGGKLPDGQPVDTDVVRDLSIWGK